MNINRDYPCNPKNYQGRRVRPVSFLVIHYVGALGGARNNALYYHNDTPGISAHYFVGHASEGAAVYLSVPEDCVASHCGRTDGKYRHPDCRNANSIGIEMCCHQDRAGRWYFDPETVDRAVELTRMLMEKYHIDANHVVRHYDVTGKICPAPFVNDQAAWERFKQRSEENDMTKEEVQAIVSAAVEAAKPRVYTSVAELPIWAQGTVQRARASGAVGGDEKGNLHLTDDNLVNLKMLDNLGLLKGRV